MKYSMVEQCGTFGENRCFGFWPSLEPSKTGRKLGRFDAVDHYSLLGLRRFTSDATEISAAYQAARQVAQVPNSGSMTGFGTYRNHSFCKNRKRPI